MSLTIVRGLLDARTQKSEQAPTPKNEAALATLSTSPARSTELTPLQVQRVVTTDAVVTSFINPTRTALEREKVRDLRDAQKLAQKISNTVREEFSGPEPHTFGPDISTAAKVLST